MTSFALLSQSMFARLLGVGLGALAGFGGVLAGCSVSASGDMDGAMLVNACSSDSACGSGYCEQGTCRSATTEVRGVLLEVTPPAGAPLIAGVRFASVIDSLEGGGPLNVELPFISRVRGKVTGAEIPASACVPRDPETAGIPSGDGSLPVRVTVIPRTRLLGLSVPTYSRDVVPSEDGDYALSLNVPAGRYDIYAEPLAAIGECERPPYLALDQEVVPGDVAFSLELPAPQKLDVTVRFPGLIDALDGWTLDVVDRDTGRLLSNRAELSSPVAEGVDGGLRYAAELVFSPVVGDELTPATELVRLSPPDGTTAPTVYIERSVVELFQDGAGVVDQLGALPDSVTYSGRVTRAGGTEGARSTVSLIATTLQQVSAGTIAAFSRTVDTEESGVFEVELLPGTYLVRIEPLDSSLAQTETTLIVSGSGPSQAGKVIQVQERSTLSGQLLSFDGTVLESAPVQATPEPVLATANVLELARGEYPFTPRSVSESTGPNGVFELLIDPGRFRLVARAEAMTGFPWAVRLGVDAGVSDEDLGSVRVSVPLVLEGTLSSSDIGSVPGALVRAYALLRGDEPTDDLDEATAVVGIGEARVDDSSAFSLLLPSELR